MQLMNNIYDNINEKMCNVIQYQQQIDSYNKLLQSSSEYTSFDHSEMSQILNEYKAKIAGEDTAIQQLYLNYDAAMNQISDRNLYKKMCNFYRENKVPLITYRRGSMIGTKMQKFIQSMPQLLELINNLAIEHECNELHNLYSINIGSIVEGVDCFAYGNVSSQSRSI
eukprot:1033607_1